VAKKGDGEVSGANEMNNETKSIASPCSGAMDAPATPARSGDALEALADALDEWEYCSSYKGEFLQQKHRDLEQIAAIRQRFGIKNDIDQDER